MKKELRYDFKRGSSRTLASSKRELIYLQSMFSSRMFIAIHHKEFIVNVDGSSFSRSVKNNCSWLPKRKSMSIKNTLCKRSTNILLAFSIDGRWFWMILSESSTHFTFCIFLFLLQNYVRFVWGNVKFPIKVMLDNTSIHLTSGTMKIAQYLKMELNYLPPYWPHLAPIELIFGALKKRITSIKIGEAIDFAKPSGKRFIIECLSQNGRDKWKNLWIHFIKEAKRIIIEVTEKEKESIMLLRAINGIYIWIF